MDSSNRIDVKSDILRANDSVASGNRDYFYDNDIFALNLISSPGAGKTSVLEASIIRLLSIRLTAVIEGDQATDFDSARILATGAECLQINTDNGCHLSAAMVAEAIPKMSLHPHSILFIENVGNLVCPAMFDLGEAMKVIVISVTEGDDKPLKYPFIFQKSKVCIINKIDLLPFVNCNIDTLKQNALSVNPDLIIFPMSATTGEGVDAWCDFILRHAPSSHCSNR